MRALARHPLFGAVASAEALLEVAELQVDRPVPGVRGLACVANTAHQGSKASDAFVLVQLPAPRLRHPPLLTMWEKPPTKVAFRQNCPEHGLGVTSARGCHARGRS